MLLHRAEPINGSRDESRFPINHVPSGTIATLDWYVKISRFRLVGSTGFEPVTSTV